MPNSAETKQKLMDRPDLKVGIRRWSGMRRASICNADRFRMRCKRRPVSCGVCSSPRLINWHRSGTRNPSPVAPAGPEPGAERASGGPGLRPKRLFHLAEECPALTRKPDLSQAPAEAIDPARPSHSARPPSEQHRLHARSACAGRAGLPHPEARSAGCSCASREAGRGPLPDEVVARLFRRNHVPRASLWSAR